MRLSSSTLVGVGVSRRSCGASSRWWWGTCRSGRQSWPATSRACTEDRLGHLFGRQRAAAVRESLTVELVSHGVSMDAESDGQFLLRRTSFIGLAEFRDLFRAQPSLKLPRTARAIGRSIIGLTSEDGLETGHDRGVGVRTQHLHCLPYGRVHAGQQADRVSDRWDALSLVLQPRRSLVA